MKVLCLVNVINPKKIPVFPPSIIHHSWFKLWMSTVVSHMVVVTEKIWYPENLEFVKPDGSFLLSFNDETEMNSTFDKIRLTDEVLISDLKIWKEAHGISFNYEYFTPASITEPSVMVP